jgi:hypothetical protein
VLRNRAPAAPAAALTAATAIALATPTRGGASVASMASEPLCTQVALVRTALAHRTGLGHAGGPRVFAFPNRVSVTKAPRARAIAAAVCGFPRLPRGRLCPVDLFVRYVIDFSGRQGRRWRVTLDPYGCQTVSGAGPTRWAALRPRFWREVGSDLGVKGATLKTFQGRH